MLKVTQAFPIRFSCACQHGHQVISSRDRRFWASLICKIIFVVEIVNPASFAAVCEAAQFIATHESSISRTSSWYESPEPPMRSFMKSSMPKLVRWKPSS